MRKNLVILLILPIISMGSALAATTPPAHAANHYEDAWTFFGRADHPSVMSTQAYDAAVRSLTAQFDAICGDTFCEGDYSNLTTLGIDCSVSPATSQIGDCTWTFAGSYATVDDDTGSIDIQRDTFVCHLGVTGLAGDLASFLTAASKTSVGGTEGLTTVVIPGQGRTLMDVLQDCL